MAPAEPPPTQTTQPISGPMKMATAIVHNNSSVIKLSDIEPFYQDEVTSAWQSDDSRAWGKPYAKTDSFVANWDFRPVEHRTK